jgi:hypothetical protein
MAYYTMVNDADEIIGIHCDDPVMWIPLNDGNSDYLRYLGWVAEGNMAEPWLPPVPEEG